MALTVYLGIDVGSVTTKVALVDEKGKYVDSYMLRTAGKPVMAVQKGLNELFAKRITDYDVMGVGTTGSGRNLAGALVGADIIKNEISQDYYQQNFPNDGQRFVAWYMRNIHLLDQCQAKDAVTDGANDKQIDAVYIDEDEQKEY